MWKVAGNRLWILWYHTARCVVLTVNETKTKLRKSLKTMNGISSLLANWLIQSCCFVEVCRCRCMTRHVGVNNKGSWLTTRPVRCLNKRIGKMTWVHFILLAQLIFWITKQIQVLQFWPFGLFYDYYVDNDCDLEFVETSGSWLSVPTHYRLDKLTHLKFLTKFSTIQIARSHLHQSHFRSG